MSSSSSSSDAKMDAALDALNNWYDDALKSGMGFKSDRERQDYLASLGDPEKHPMFAQNTEDMEGHPYVEALRAIKEEDKSPVELAVMYKEEGNEWMKKTDKKSLHEAYDRYTHALGFLDKAEAARREGSEDEKDKAEDLRRHRSQVLSNRAQASLTLTNYGSCKKDCDAALSFWAENIKAHYRKCRALFLLRDYANCNAACQLALSVDHSNKDIQALLAKSTAELEKLQSAKNRALERAWQELHGKLSSVWTLARTENIRLGLAPCANPEPLQLRSAWPAREDGELYWPLLFLYPQYNKFDILTEAQTSALLAQHLAMIFPEKEDCEKGVDWDQHEEYQASNLVVYLQLDCGQEAKSEEDWLVGGLEYNITVESGSVDMMKYALEGLIKRSSPPAQSLLGYSLDMLPELTVEQVSRIAEQREQVFNKKLKTIYDAATAQKPTLKYLDVHMGCTIQTILAAHSKRNVLPRGVLTLIVFPRGSKAHKKFLKTIASENFTIDPLNP